MIICLDEIIATADDSEIGYFVDVDMDYTDTIENKTGYFPFCPECKKVD